MADFEDVCNIDRVYAMGSNSSMPFACPETNVGEIATWAKQTVETWWKCKEPQRVVDEHAQIDVITTDDSHILLWNYNNE